jgi:hypothetical protein
MRNLTRQSLAASLLPILLRGLVCVGLLGAPADAQPAGTSVVHVGFTSRSLASANRADVTAAMKAWLQIVARERKLALVVEPEIFDSVGDMGDALHHERLEVFSATTEEFVVLEKSTPVAKIFASIVGGKIQEQYVLLVRRDRTIRDLRDLRGETLILLEGPRTSLAPLWLDTELLRGKLPVRARFFAKITIVKKPNLAILPVFFRQAGAALVSRTNFEIAGELNPQLTKDVRVLVASPEVIPALGGFRANAVSGAVDLYRREALRIGESPGGKLVLNLFQTDGVAEIKESDLVGTRALLAEYARLSTEGARH